MGLHSGSSTHVVRRLRSGPRGSGGAGGHGRVGAAGPVLDAYPVGGQGGTQASCIDESGRVPTDARLQQTVEACGYCEVLGLGEQQEGVLVGGVVDGRAWLEVGREVELGVVGLEHLGVTGRPCDIGGEPVQELHTGTVPRDVDVDEHEDGLAVGGPDGCRDLGGRVDCDCLRLVSREHWSKGDNSNCRIGALRGRGSSSPGGLTLVSSQVTLRSGAPGTGKPGATVAATPVSRAAHKDQLTMVSMEGGRGYR